MNRNPDCDERINAWLDGEAASAEREEIFAALGADPALERRACELRRVKALVRHAYEDIAPPLARRAPRLSAARAAAAALALFAVGVGTGWGLSEWRSTSPSLAAGVHAAAALPSQHVPGVVIQVADRDPEKWQLAIDQAGALVDPEWNRDPLDVVIVAYGPGLGMLRDGSRVTAAVRAALGRGIRFVACGNTMENEHVADRELLPGVTIARAGASLEILALERAGYAYVRI
jgi:intracellular sulfur oxidation DsrE/DsrF family protein